MENERVCSNAGEVEDSIEAYYLIRNLADKQYDRFPTRLGNRKDFATEQLKRLSDGGLVLESLWREKADNSLATTKNEIYDVSEYVCDELSRIDDEKRYLKTQLCGENPIDEIVHSQMQARFSEEGNAEAHEADYIRNWQSNLGNGETSNEVHESLVNSTWPKRTGKGWSRQFCQTNRPRRGSCDRDENYYALLNDRNLHEDEQSQRYQPQIRKTSLELEDGVTRPLEGRGEKSCADGIDCGIKDQMLRNAYFEKNDRWERHSQLLDFRKGTISTVKHDEFRSVGNSCNSWTQAYSNADLSLNSTKEEIYHSHIPWKMEENEEITVAKQFQFEDGLSN